MTIEVVVGTLGAMLLAILAAALAYLKNLIDVTVQRYRIRADQEAAYMIQAAAQRLVEWAEQKYPDVVGSHKFQKVAEHLMSEFGIDEFNAEKFIEQAVYNMKQWGDK